MPSLPILALATLAVTIPAAIVYMRVWRRRDPRGRTPTGFGLLLAPVLLVAALAGEAPSRLLLALAVNAAATAWYWWDDVAELRARVRLGIGAGSGLLFAGVLLTDGNVTVPLVLVVAALAAAAATAVCVINMINFMDGADLNLAVQIFLTGLLLLAYGPAQGPWPALAVACMAFAAGFALFNRRPRTLYLGDAGSFAFAGFVTVLGVFFVRGIDGVPAEAAIPLALPAVDCAYVLRRRLVEKHDLLSRNYLHLYQRLERHAPRFVYLTPQLANVALCLAAAALLEALGLPRLWAVVAGTAIVTVAGYAALRRWYIAPRDRALAAEPA